MVDHDGTMSAMVDGKRVTNSGLERQVAQIIGREKKQRVGGQGLGGGRAVLPDIGGHR